MFRALQIAVLLVVGTFMSLLACTPPAPPAQDTAAMIAAAEALDARFVAAMHAGDVNAMAALYWNDPQVVSFLPDVMEARGPAAIRQALAQTAEGMRGGTLELYDARHQVAGDIVLTLGRWRFTMPQPDGAPPVVVLGRYTDAKAERDGAWVYLWDHASVPTQ